MSIVSAVLPALTAAAMENVIAAGAFVLRKAIDAPDVTRALSSVTREDDQLSH